MTDSRLSVGWRDRYRAGIGNVRRSWDRKHHSVRGAGPAVGNDGRVIDRVPFPRPIIRMDRECIRLGRFYVGRLGVERGAGAKKSRCR